MVEVNLFAVYLWLVLAYGGGIVTCALFAFSRREDDTDQPEAGQ